MLGGAGQSLLEAPPGGGRPLDKCSQVACMAQGPPVLDLEWTVGTGSQVRENTAVLGS